MKAKDKIIKASWNHFEGTKDVIMSNILNASRDGKVKIDESTLPKLLSLLNSSFEEGYHKGFLVFDKEITSSLKDNAKISSTKKN
jgi:hypothetical protein